MCVDLHLFLVKRVFIITCVSVVLLSVVVAVFLGATHSVLGRIFTRDKYEILRHCFTFISFPLPPPPVSLFRDVVDGVGEVLYLTIPLVFSDGFQVYTYIHTLTNFELTQRGYPH